MNDAELFGKEPKDSWANIFKNFARGGAVFIISLLKINLTDMKQRFQGNWMERLHIT